ncbi:MAG: FliO/MopB family protein [Thermodesulfobacteriota bacterium]
MAGETLWPAMLKMIAGLLIIIGVLYVGSALLRRFQFGGGGVRTGVIRIKETRPLGAKRMLCLVEVRGREVLLGVSPERIETLCQFDAPAEAAAEEPAFDQVLDHQQTR